MQKPCSSTIDRIVGALLAAAMCPHEHDACIRVQTLHADAARQATTWQYAMPSMTRRDRHVTGARRRDPQRQLHWRNTQAARMTMPDKRVCTPRAPAFAPRPTAHASWHSRPSVPCCRHATRGHA
jgi:hypothetical protein